MYATDFEYDGQTLSSYGFIICDFDFSSGAVEVNAGSVITFNKVPMQKGKLHSLTSTQYDECITTTFDICKDPDAFELEDRLIDNEEYRNITRWLNRREFLKFCVLDYNEIDNNLCYFNASFNVSKIKINENLYGIRLKMETDKPFAYGAERTHIFNFSGSNLSTIFSDDANEIGISYPILTITCSQSGDLSITNKDEGCTTTIKNCSENEVITLDGAAQVITTNLPGHDITDDFNYEFFRVANYYRHRNNTISVSAPCKIVMKYAPIIKDIP